MARKERVTRLIDGDTFGTARRSVANIRVGRKSVNKAMKKYEK